MNTPDFTITFLVDQTPEEVFNAINNVRGWWSEGVEGGTEKLNDEFIYRYPEFHYSKQKLTEVVPNKKVVWLVTDSALTFVKKKDEWTNTKISFDITPKGNKTAFRFTHIGLVPQNECFDSCSGGWMQYISGSLFKLITTGKGEPDKMQEA
jgi:hypothetical protein